MYEDYQLEDVKIFLNIDYFDTDIVIGNLNLKILLIDCDNISVSNNMYYVTNSNKVIYFSN